MDKFFSVQLGLAHFDYGAGDCEAHEALMLCFSLEYVTFLMVTPNMTSVHIINRRPLFTHLGEFEQGTSHLC
jgi:hypothetical protein